MIRQHVFSERTPTDPLFRWRGGAVSRLEGFSDAVFALALTLLVVGLGGLDTFSEVVAFFVRLPVLVVCVVLLVHIWHLHYIFFRRYGLEDAGTVALNTIVLFTVLAFVFPLKFIATILWEMIAGLQPTRARTGFGDDPGLLMLIYAGGYAAIFAALALMNWRAWGARKRLELDAVERFLTLASIWKCGIHIAVGALAMALTVFVSPQVAGFSFFSLGPLMGIEGWLSGSKAQRLAERDEIT